MHYLLLLLASLVASTMAIPMYDISDRIRTGKHVKDTNKLHRNRGHGAEVYDEIAHTYGVLPRY
jgi:hypothetical protein